MCGGQGIRTLRSFMRKRHGSNGCGWRSKLPKRSGGIRAQPFAFGYVDVLYRVGPVLGAVPCPSTTAFLGGIAVTTAGGGLSARCIIGPEGRGLYRGGLPMGRTYNLCPSRARGWWSYVLHCSPSISNLSRIPTATCQSNGSRQPCHSALQNSAVMCKAHPCFFCRARSQLARCARR